MCSVTRLSAMYSFIRQKLHVEQERKSSSAEAGSPVETYKSYKCRTATVEVNYHSEHSCSLGSS